MGRSGPCLHCGIEHTPLWRAGPPEKKCLCNACGTSWKKKGTLAGYTPRHGINEQSSLLDEKKAMAPAKCVTNNESGALNSFQRDYPDIRITPTAKAEAREFPLGFKVPRRKRSVLPQYCLTSIGRLHRQLLQIQHEQQSAAKTSDAGVESENEMLIYNTGWMHDE